MRITLSYCFLLLCVLPLWAQNEPVYEKVDRIPLFGDCNQKDIKEATACSEKALMAFLMRNLKYPELARENNIQGAVYITFTVKKDGTTSDCKVMRDIGGGCAAEGVRVIQMMRSWQPGMLDGKPVNSLMTLPIRFKLDEGNNVTSAQLTLYASTFTDEEISKTNLQKALSVPPTVRDAAGNALKIQQLTLTVEGRRKPKSITITEATPTNAMRKLAGKTRKGGSAMLAAKVMKDGKPISVERVWTVN
jgi:TonB family protein